MNLKEKNKSKPIDKEAEDFLFDLYLKVDEYIDKNGMSLESFYEKIDSYPPRHYELRLGRVNPTVRTIIKLTLAIGKKISIS